MSKFNLSIIALGFALFCFAQGNFNYIEQESQLKAQLLKKIRSNQHKSISGTYDITYARFNWTIDPSIQYIKGEVYFEFEALEALPQLLLLLHSQLTVDSIRYHGTYLTFHHTHDTLQIILPSTLPIHMRDSITIFYQGVPPSSGFGSFITTTHGNNVPVLWTLSEPYGAYEWWPTKNDLKDKIDSIDIIVSTPPAYVAASNGVLVKDTIVQTQRIMHWKHRYPIVSYLVAIAVTNYDILSYQIPLSTGTLPFVDYVYPENSQVAMGAFPVLKTVMQFYDSLIGPYPFMREKYGQAEFGWGGGMEHQTMSFIGDMGNYELTAHELSHMWFGDAITCGSWQDIWLNEGFATYFTALNYEHFFPTVYWMPWKRQTINYITSEPGGSVYVYDTTDVYRIFDGRLSYRKGAYVLHMLRWVLGDSVFFSAIRNYYENPIFQYGFAKTSDFKQFLENFSGKDLTEFFNDWVYHEGYPIYSWKAEYYSEDTTAFTIYQTQSHPSVSYFEMPVPIVCWKNGSSQYFVLNNTYDGQTFLLPFPFPDSIQFDPNLWILKQLPVQGTLSMNSCDVSPIKIYPNPVPQGENIYINLPDVSDVYLFSSDGKRVYMQFQVQTLILNSNHMDKGLYFIKVLSPLGKISMQPLIVF